MKAAVIGIGLIGGSFALTLKDKGICEEVIGVDNSERNRAKAVELGLVDRTLPLDEAIPAADLIVLATPVDSIPLLAVKVLNKVDRQVAGGRDAASARRHQQECHGAGDPRYLRHRL